MTSVRASIFVFFALLAALGASERAQGQAVVANVNTLRTQTSGFGGNPFIVLSGFYNLSDGGGGTLVNMGSAYACQEQKMRATVSGTSQTVTLQSGDSLPTNIVLGMGISGSALGIPANDTVTGFAQRVGTTAATITLAAAASGGTGTVTLTGDNGGTSFVDYTNYCFVRLTQTYSQAEWGVWGDGAHDDTSFLQNWLNAPQPHIAVPGNSIITQGLVCSNPNGFSNYGGTIQGPPPSAAGVANANYPFTITAGDTVSGFSFTGTAMLTMQLPHCAIAGVAMIGNDAPGTTYDIVDALSNNDAVLDHSYLYGGLNGYNCTSTLSGAEANDQVFDSTIVRSVNDGILGACPNAKFQRNIISTTGGDAIYTTATQALIEGNVIEQATGNGVNCTEGGQIAIVGNYFDDNGKIPPPLASGQNLYVNSCQAVSITGNQFHRGSAGGEGTFNTAQVMFAGINDSVSMAGNVNYVGSDTGAVALRPDYDVEFATPAAPGLNPTIVTNFSYSDSPTPQNKGVFGPNAMAALGPLQSAEPQNYLTGLVTSNSGTSATLSIAPGAAMDGSNAQLINLPAGCSVNLNAGGAGGLDTGRGTVAANTQYNFFTFAQGSYGSAPACIATLGTNSAPSFVTAFPPPGSCAASPPSYSVPLQVTINSGSNVLVSANVPGTGVGLLNPLAGLAVGDTVIDCGGRGYIAANSTISSLNSISVIFTGVTSATSQYVTSLSSTTNLYVGETIGNSMGDNEIASGSTIIAINPSSGCTAPCLEMNQDAANTSPVGGSALAASTNATIVLNNNTSTSSCSSTPSCTDTIYVYNDRYRMLAALYTNGSSNIEPFTQDNDTFYLASPPLAYNGSVGTSATPITLASVPDGMSVEAFGRCVGGATTGTHHVLLYSPSLTPLAPAGFPSPPGFDVSSLTANVAFPFRAYTDTSQRVDALAEGTSTLQCMIDGWNWHRGR